MAEQVKRRGAAVRPAGSWRSGCVCVAAQCNPFRRSGDAACVCRSAMQCNAFRRSGDAACVCRSAMQSIQPGVPECFSSPRARSLVFSADAMMCEPLPNRQLSPTGIELVSTTTSPDNILRKSADQGAAKSGAVFPEIVQVDPDLLAVIEAWPRLEEAVRAGIVTMVRASREGSR